MRNKHKKVLISALTTISEYMTATAETMIHLDIKEPEIIEHGHELKGAAKIMQSWIKGIEDIK